VLPSPFTHALVLTGPTGSGKTPLALELAEGLGAEIISMDSMALYRGMDIGTAKPTPAERSRIAHHLIDVLEPSESGSVAWWLEQARDACLDIERRGKRVLIVGGTPLYLKALVRGLFKGPAANAELRQRLQDAANLEGAAALHRRLAEVDPISAARLHINDRRRIIRALEVAELTGKPISAWQEQWRASETPATQSSNVLWLDLPRAVLYDRIDRRVEAMFAAGLVDEVDHLRASGQALSMEASQALGYREVLAYLQGKQGLLPTMDRIKTRTRNFAKRQITWFRHLPNCRPATTQLTRDLWHPTMK
jgi:tRNA dimethylallyltransferase